MKEHPEYFQSSRAASASPSDEQETSEQNSSPAVGLPSHDDKSSDNVDFIEFTKNGKRIRLGSTLPSFNPNYTFDKFIEGESNKFAKAACYAVATKPASGYNPLFIHGASGLDDQVAALAAGEGHDSLHGILLTAVDHAVGAQLQSLLQTLGHHVHNVDLADALSLQRHHGYLLDEYP